MRRIAAMGLLGLLLPALCAAGALADELAETQAMLKRLDEREAASAAALDGLKDLGKRSTAQMLGRGSLPSLVYGHLGGSFQDFAASGLGARRSTAASLGVYFRLDGALAGGARYYLVFDVRHAPDDEDLALPKPLGGASQVAFHRLRLGATGQGYALQGGYLEVKNSALTLAGSSSGRPSFFERDRYAETQLAKDAWLAALELDPKDRYQPGRFPWGLQGNADLLDAGHLQLFMLVPEGFYGPPATALRDAGGRLTWDLGADGGSVGVAAFNRFNDSREIIDAGGSTSNAVSGLQMNTVLTAIVDQSFLGLRWSAEGGGAWFDSPLLHAQGLGMVAKVSKAMGAWDLALSGQVLEPGFISGGPSSVGPTGPAGDLNPQLFLPGVTRTVQGTSVDDPSKAMGNAAMAGFKLRYKPSFGVLNVGVRSGSQLSPSSSQLRAAHGLGGDNASGAAWWQLFGGSYAPWVRQGSAAEALDATSSRSRALDLYNRSTLTNGPRSDSAGDLDYPWEPYRELDVSGWRDATERIELADPVSGLPLAPSTKSISIAFADWRLRLDKLFGMERGFYLLAYQDLVSVRDGPPGLPLVQGGLFQQSVGQLTAVLQAGERLFLILNAGHEDWTSDAQPLSIRPWSPSLAAHPGRLEYHDRQAGLGLDWDLLPNALSFYARFKVLEHHDSAYEPNDFQSRQLWLEAKSFF